jgi:hypothetical protein
MKVFEVRYPGVWLDGLPDEPRREAEALISVLVSQLADAAMGLALFEEQRSVPIEAPDVSAHGEAVRELVGNMSQEHLARVDPATVWNAVDLYLRRQEWSSGRVPDSYMRRLLFIHAHTVLYALDAIGKALTTLAGNTELPDGVRDARDGYAAALPHLISIRNSAQHIEDRARGRGPRKKVIALQPVASRMIHAPQGALIIDSLDDNKLGYTGADGHHVEIEISSASVAIAQTAIQTTIDAFAWRGPSRTEPN